MGPFLILNRSSGFYLLLFAPFVFHSVPQVFMVMICQSESLFPLLKALYATAFYDLDSVRVVFSNLEELCSSTWLEVLK